MESLITNDRGVITFQFLIVLVIVLFFVISFFGLALTLVNGSAVQYLTYSSARKLSLGDVDIETQQDNAKEQYQKLRQKLFKSKYTSSNEWFQISPTPQLGLNSTYQDTDNFRKMFYGSSADFISNRTNFKIPFLTDEDDGGLSTTIASYVGREVTKVECENFNEARMSEICTIYNQALGGACAGSGNTPSDNGC